MNVTALLAAIAVNVPVTPGVQVTVGQCPGLEQAGGCAIAGQVWVMDSGIGDWNMLALAHEMGHEFDLANLNDATRLHWKQSQGIKGDGWWQTTAVKMSPAEEFADEFALCAIGPRRRRRIRYGTFYGDYYHGAYEGMYGEYIPSGKLAQTCWWLRSLM